jgi:signal peptidase II
MWMAKVKRDDMLKKQRKISFFASGLCWSWIAIIVLLIDFITKFLAKKYLSLYSPYPIFPGFNFSLSFNKGAAFSFLKDQPGWQVWFLGIISAVVTFGILIWLSRLSRREVWTSIALSFIAGGALGNLLDRIMQGQVTDFIQFYISHFYWPTFNIADSAICIGAVMLLGKMVLKNNLKVPNAHTQKAMSELESGKGKRFNNIHSLMDDLNKDN